MKKNNTELKKVLKTKSNKEVDNLLSALTDFRKVSFNLLEQWEINEILKCTNISIGKYPFKLNYDNMIKQIAKWIDNTVEQIEYNKQ